MLPDPGADHADPQSQSRPRRRLRGAPLVATWAALLALSWVLFLAAAYGVYRLVLALIG